MNATRSVHIGLAFAVLAAAALVGGCESSDPAAQSDWTLKITANPADVTLGQNSNGTSDILATVYDKNGIPQSGVGVRFATSFGTLASNNAIVQTNARGEARDTLTTSGDSTVTALSGSLSAQVNVTVGGVNSPPAANATASPDPGRRGRPILFSGAASEDLDGEIVSYQWTFFSNNPDNPANNPEVITQTTSGYERTFANAQIVDVTLRVTDDLGATATDVIAQYNVVANLKPTADVTPSTTNGFVSPSPAPYSCSVTLSASGSADSPNDVSPGLAAYDWATGDGRTIRTTGPSGNWSYTTPGTYSVVLRVWDNGPDGSCPTMPAFGQPDTCPNSPSSSGRQFAEDTATVTCPARS